MIKDVKISIRINEEEKNRIIAEAVKKDIPVAQLIREAIREYLKEEKK